MLSTGHTGKVGPGTRDSGPGTIPGTRDPGPFTWDLGPGSRDFSVGPEPATLHLKPFTWDLGPGRYMWDPIQGTNAWHQSKKTHFVYQRTVFCIVLILIYSLEISS